MNRKEIFVLSLITFLTVVAWIAFGIYHAKKSSKISEVQLKEITPLSPNFDINLLDELATRQEE